MSNHNLREQLIAAVMRAVAAFQDAADQVDESAAGRLGLNRTDLRCLGILTRAERMTAGQLAAAARLSAGAATTAGDRLARGRDPPRGPGAQAPGPGPPPGPAGPARPSPPRWGTH